MLPEGFAMKKLLDESDEQESSLNIIKFTQSMEIAYKRIDLKAEHHDTLPTQNGRTGIILMLWYVLHK